jgi:uncharacterized delta-60 repeat protein
MKKLILLSTVFCCSVKISCSQAGQPDPTFGNKGIVKTDLGSPYNYSNTGKQVLVQPDGSIYMVFECNGTSLITKKLSNGSADATYGINGFSASVSISGPHAAIQADGKIIVVGSVRDRNGYTDNSDFAVARFNTNGTLDNSFDGDGIKTTNGVDDPESDNVATCVAIQSDGKIVVGGYSGRYDAFTPVFSLMRFNTDGSLDGGITTDFNNVGRYESIAIQSDGKILAAGNNFTDLFTIFRYNSDFSPDNSFSDDGKQTVNMMGK